MRKQAISLAFCAGIVLLGCELGLDDTADTPFAPAFDHKGSPHGAGNGGPGGGGGDQATYDLTITEGVLASESGIVLKRDNNKALMVDFAAGTWNMSNTHAAADLERTSPATDDVCAFTPADMDNATKQILVGTLLAARVTGELGVDKRLAKGWVKFTNQPDGVWSSWGFNTQTDEPGGADVTDNGSGVDWNDPSARREYRYSGGFIRVLNAGLPEPGDGVELLCRVLDDALIVLAPE